MPRYQFNLRAILVTTAALAAIFAAASRQVGWGVLVALLVIEAYAAAWAIRRERDPVRTAILAGLMAMAAYGCAVETTARLCKTPLAANSAFGALLAMPFILVGGVVYALPFALVSGVIVGMSVSLSAPVFQSLAGLFDSLRRRFERKKPRER